MKLHRHEILLRRSKPEDSAMVGALIYSTGPHFFDHVFGKGRIKICRLLECLYRKRTGIFSFHFSTVAVCQGRVVGLVLVYDKWQRRLHSLLNNFYVLTRYSPVKIIWMLYRDFHVKRFIKRIPRRSLYVAHLAVIPQFQGQGIGQSLLKIAIEAAKISGYANCSLDVLVTNTAALRLYEKMGFTIVNEIRHKNLEEKYKLKGQFRMIKQLLV
mgnify:CR=1 FL=1